METVMSYHVVTFCKDGNFNSVHDAELQLCNNGEIFIRVPKNRESIETVLNLHCDFQVGVATLSFWVKLDDIFSANV